MTVSIIATESLGVRGLCCLVKLEGRSILIDPGIALGWMRNKLLPHPFQIAAGISIRKNIIRELRGATDIIFSHFHGDHCPLREPNPYQLGIDEVRDLLVDRRLWAKGADSHDHLQLARREELSKALGKKLPGVEGRKEGPLEFSDPVPHGKAMKNARTVMMSRIEEEGQVFVHASDIQFLDRKTVNKIISWRPDVVFVSGPPLYRYGNNKDDEKEEALKNAAELSACTGMLIIDHHLLRSDEGFEWLAGLRSLGGGEVLSAAEYMGREPVLLEAWREQLYRWLPVPKGWHDDYQRGNADLETYRKKGWDILMEKGKLQPCKWYYCCPVRTFTERGLLERDWIENYCLVGNKRCVRYNMEERGEYHPDNMLPDGEVRENLK